MSQEECLNEEYKVIESISRAGVHRFDYQENQSGYVTWLISADKYKAKSTYIDRYKDTKLNLSKFDYDKVTAVYTLAGKTLVEIKKDDIVIHKIYVKGHQNITKDWIIGEESNDPIEGLITTQIIDSSEVLYHNFLCGMQGSNKCMPVIIDGEEKSGNFILRPTTKNTQINREFIKEKFSIDTQKIVSDDSIKLTHTCNKYGENSKIEFYSNDDLIHTAIILNGECNDIDYI